MSVFVRIAIAMSLLCISQGALAKDTTEEAARCAELLSKPTAVDYALSDLEGLFFDVVKKAQDGDHLTPSRAEAYIKDFLNMKAQLLNRIIGLLPAAEKPEMVASIYQMLDTLGVPPALYGLKLDEQGHLLKQGPTYKSGPLPAETRGPSIGFVNMGEFQYRDLPEGLHRSIGFGPQRVESDPLPDRVTGMIQRMISKKDPNVLIVYDGEKKIAYAANLQLLHLGGIQIGDHTYQLEFNQEYQEWVVVVQNLANPSGKIGF